MLKKVTLLILFIILCQSAGLIGSVFTFQALQDWYPLLNKPFFTPPSFIFGPVWIILYLLMGISLFLAWNNKKIKLNWFWTQLGLNIIWSAVFFGLQNPALGFIVIISLIFTIIKTIKVFGKHDKLASYLLYPYLAWISFATILNFSIMILNY